ncbi:MAG: bifunctional hydroxymethylpyrimidine kinase/phosphomethylpyrimidine kinase [bacterium]
MNNKLHRPKEFPPPVALTIAASDPTSGAGIQADLRTFTAFGVHGLSVITAITSQNTITVEDVVPLNTITIRNQFDTLNGDIPISFAKTGVICNSSTVLAVADMLRDSGIRVVVDTPFKSGTGRELMEVEGVQMLIKKLLPMAFLLTPNIPEAERIASLKINCRQDMENAAKKIRELGVSAVLLKGGHLEGDESPDYFISDSEECWFESPRLIRKNIHGTGCTLSAAITANLALGFDLHSAIKRAKDFLTNAINTSFRLGDGALILNTEQLLKPE